MVRYEDSPGVEKHLRFGNYSQELYDVLVGFPGIKAIVLHTHGAKGEHPHIHVWYEADKPITNQTVRNRLKAYNDLFKSCKSQNDWSFRNHDDWDAWKNYVCSNPSHKVLLDYQDLKACSEAKSMIVAVTPRTPADLNAPGPRTVVAPKKRLTQSEKLIAYCVNDLKWKRDNEFNLQSYETGFAQRKVAKTMTQFLRGRFNDPQAVYILRNMLYEFADDDLKEVLEFKFPESAIKFL